MDYEREKEGEVKENNYSSKTKESVKETHHFIAIDKSSLKAIK
jgi:hypothetical protein